MPAAQLDPGARASGNEPFTLTRGSYTLNSQWWIKACIVPAPTECSLAMYIWIIGLYGWYEAVGNLRSRDPCTVNKRLGTTFKCSPSVINFRRRSLWAFSVRNRPAEAPYIEAYSRV
jgi:hypothetical protein